MSKAKDVAIVQVFQFPFHHKCGTFDEYGRWFPNADLNFDKVFDNIANYPSPLDPLSFMRFFYSLRYARILARNRPFVYRKYHGLKDNTFLILFHKTLYATRKRGKRPKKKKIVRATPEPYMYQYVQVSAPFSNNPRWYSILRIRNDHRLAERYVARLKIPEHMYGYNNPSKACIRHVRVFTYTVARRVFDTELNARYFMRRCYEEINSGYREDEIPEYLDRDTGELCKVETMLPQRIVKELREIEVSLIGNRLLHVKETDVVVPIVPKNTKTVVVKDIPAQLYDDVKRVASVEGITVGGWIRTAIEAHMAAMRYAEMSHDKEIFPNIDISKEDVVFDTPVDGQSVVLENNEGVEYVIDF